MSKTVLKRFLSKISTLHRLSWRQIAWLLVLLPLSGVIRFSLLILPFRWLAPVMLGQYHHPLNFSPVVSDELRRRAVWLGELCQMVGRNTPWASLCLVQAVLARFLFAVYGIPYVIYLGVAHVEEHGKKILKAHAWVKVGECIVTGRAGHQSFTIVSTFIPPSLA